MPFHCSRLLAATFAVVLATVLAVSFSQAQQSPGPAATASSLPPEVAAGHAAFAKEDWAAAIEHYRAALAAGHDLGIVQMHLGYALHMQGKYEEAMPHHLKAGLAMNKDIRKDGWYNAACASALMGKRDDALKYMVLTIDAGFADADHARNDSDLKSLREDKQFNALLDGIPASTHFVHWMDFFIGEWTNTAADGHVIQKITFTKPLENSHGLHSVSTNQGSVAWTGLAYPRADDRTWRWVEVTAIGISHDLIGVANDFGGVTFTGRDVTANGPDLHIRLSYSPQADGSIREVCQVSEDGKTWRTHHDAKYTKTK